MPRHGYSLLLVCALLAAGCAGPTARPEPDQKMFGAVSFRIHPTFTQIKDWTGDGINDGVEAVVEFQDQFGEPTRSTGTVRFELYKFEPTYPDHRGTRLAMWAASLDSQDDQVARWDAAARGYIFQLAYDKLSAGRSYVLMAQVDRSNSRLFDEIVLESSTKDGFHGDHRNQHAPSGAPGHGY